MSELSDKAIAEFGEVLDGFKKKMQDAVETSLRDVYCELPKWIETDAWTNYREAMRQELCSDKIDTVVNSDGHWARNVRKQILKDHRDELIQSLDKDSLAEIENLRAQIKSMHERRIY